MEVPGSEVIDLRFIDKVDVRAGAECDFCDVDEANDALRGVVHLQVCMNEEDGVQKVFISRICESCRDVTLKDTLLGVFIVKVA